MRHSDIQFKGTPVSISSQWGKRRLDLMRGCDFTTVYLTRVYRGLGLKCCASHQLRPPARAHCKIKGQKIYVFSSYVSGTRDSLVILSVVYVFLKIESWKVWKVDALSEAEKTFRAQESCCLTPKADNTVGQHPSDKKRK